MEFYGDAEHFHGSQSCAAPSAIYKKNRKESSRLANPRPLHGKAQLSDLGRYQCGRGEPPLTCGRRRKRAFRVPDSRQVKRQIDESRKSAFEAAARRLAAAKLANIEQGEVGDDTIGLGFCAQSTTARLVRRALHNRSRDRRLGRLGRHLDPFVVPHRFCGNFDKPHSVERASRRGGRRRLHLGCIRFGAALSPNKTARKATVRFGERTGTHVRSSTLWTAAHTDILALHRAQLNRAYHQEDM